MSALIECPICMDSIEISKNCVTTECGHCFHTNCLMKNVTHNGFSCPYCRTIMAEEPEDEEDEEDEEDDINETNYLRGFRLFWNNMNGEEHDVEDTLREVQFEVFNLEDHAQEEELPIDIPSHEFIADKLKAKGLTYEDLVKAFLGRGDHPEYPEYYYQNLDNEVYGRIRYIISRYDPPQNVSPVEPLEIR